MSAVLDNFLVGLALLISVGYAVSSLGPKTWRNRVATASSRLLARAPAFIGLAGVARRLSAASRPVPGAAGACGGCDNCGTAQAEAPQSASAEVKVPVANVGRREIETPAAATRR
jgi:hypothetical protein